MADETKLTVVKSNVANALSSAAADHVIAVTEDIYDEGLGEYQSVINQSIKSYKEGYGIEITPDNTINSEVYYQEGIEGDDAARAILGGDWKIPTKEDWNELISSTTAEWNDGIQLTSKINGQTIFLPAGGTYVDYEVDGNALAGTYWTSSAALDAAPNNLIAHDVLFDMGGSISVRSFNKYNGELIRPVTKTPGNNVVDLGLPSGTLWSTRNLTSTGLTSSIASYGDYFAWGEIAPKSEYSYETYSLKNSYNTTDGIFILRTGGEAGYFTRHNDELQTKLKAGDNITISNGIISAVGGDLSNYYNKTEVDNKISAVPKFSISVVSTLPTTKISSTTVYLVANTTTQTQNLYTEYIYVNSKWEKLGEQTIDLSGYATTTALSTKQDSLTTAQLSAVNSGITSTKVSTYDGYANSIANKVDKASGKGLSTNDYTTTEKNKLAGIAEGANNYSHPTYTSKTSGLYKITVDGTGHVSGTAAVTASDLPSHSHTGYLTSETDPVFSASAAAGITSADITNWNAKGTSNLTIGTTATTAAAGNHTHSNYVNNTVDFKILNLTNVSKNILTAVKEFATTPVTEGYIYTTSDGGSSGVTDKPIAGKGFGCKVYLTRYASSTDYRYDLVCWASTALSPYYAIVINSTTAITWTQSAKKTDLDSYLPLTGGTLTGPLKINPGAANNFTEGIRINQATDGWSLINLGGAANSTDGAGGWLIARRGNNAATGSFGSTGDLTIQNGDSSGATGITIRTDGFTCVRAGIAAQDSVRVGASSFSSNSVTGGCAMTYNATDESLDFIF